MGPLVRSLLFLILCSTLAILTSCASSNSQSTQPPQPTYVFAYLHRSGIPGDYTRYELMAQKSDGTSVTVAATDQYISTVLGPDGQTVLFSHYVPGPGYQIATINVNGTGVTTLGDGLYPNYTPDGSRIVYEVGDGALGIMNADGSNPTIITGVGEFCFPATNGSIIAAGMYNGGTQGLATMNMDGSNPQVIVGTSYSVFPAFAASGSTIIFSMSSPTEQNIYSVSTNGTGLVSLTNSTTNWDPVVVGSTIYFDSIPNTTVNPTTDSNQIYSITMSGSNLTAVTDDTLYDGFKTANGLCIAP